MFQFKYNNSFIINRSPGVIVFVQAMEVPCGKCHDTLHSFVIGWMNIIGIIDILITEFFNTKDISVSFYTFYVTIKMQDI